MIYKGTMLSGVPNLTFTFGYTNSSWTLKADLVSEYAVRLLRYMDGHGYAQAVPANDDPSVTDRPMLDFQSGYVQRAIHEFPRSGSRSPWRVRMNYPYDLLVLRYGRINDGVLRFSRRRAAPAAAKTTQQAPAAS
jgi:monooxygenase